MRSKTVIAQMIRLTIFLLLLLFLAQCTFRLRMPPKREFRGAWIATVANIDWPKHFNDAPQKQKEDLVRLLDALKRSGINAVFFQVRPECDALYQSNYEPWSYWLTGKQGKAPVPFYDSLQFAIREAHKRGMELHAWFNPYRAERIIGKYPLAPDHVVNSHPEWILSFTENGGKLRILNPGIPAVRQYVTRVVMDVVKRYDIDGVHFDDYFYPYPNNDIARTNKDSLTFAEYKHGDASDSTIGSWRRENVNILMRMIHDSIRAVKPFVKFGVSPFGIYRKGQPEGVKGMDAYEKIYCDPLAWLKDRSVDYVTPQLYWRIGGAQDFKKLLQWWGEQAAKEQRHLYVGHIFGRRFSEDELPRQLKLVRKNKNAQGDVYFSAKHFVLNTLNFDRRVKEEAYRFPALPPEMGWKVGAPPDRPKWFTFSQPDRHSTARFRWAAVTGEEADSTIRFVLYRFTHVPADSEPPHSPADLYQITGGHTYLPPPPVKTVSQLFFALSAVNRNGQESKLSNGVKIVPPRTPQAITASNGNLFVPDTFCLKWRLQPDASTYRVQVALDSAFSKLVKDERAIAADSLTISGLSGNRRYLWRVAAENPAGQSRFTRPGTFLTGFPAAPPLLIPEDGKIDSARHVLFRWKKSEKAMRYELQLARESDFATKNIVRDTVLADTSVNFTLPQDSTMRWLFWRVKAKNKYGAGHWSEVYRFRRGDETKLPAAPYMESKFKSIKK